MNIVLKTSLIFTIIGAINWGLVGIFSFNLVEWICGVNTVLTRIIYIVVALAGLINIILLFIDLDRPKVMKDKVHD